MNKQHPAIDALFTAVVETTKESVINALCTAQPIEGAMAIAWKPCRLIRPSPFYNVTGLTYQ